MSKSGNSQAKPSLSMWDVAPPGASIELAQWSTEHYQRHGRPLRLAIDAHYWRHHFENHPKVKWLRKSPREINEVEKTIMYQIMTLLELSIHLLFVFDGPDSYHHDNPGSTINTPEKMRLFKDLLNHLGVPFHQAPAEAAPTCVKLHELGVVDAVWTNHSVALTCECRQIVFFETPEKKWKGTGIADKLVIRHDATALLQQRGLGQLSLILGLLLGGCEYSKGLPGITHHTALEIAQNASQLAKTMHDVFYEGGDKIEMNKWRARFRAFLKDNGYPSVSIPNSFPDLKAIGRYRSPPLRSENELRNLLCLRHGWTQSLADNLADICQFLTRNFHSYPNIKWPIRHLTGLELNHRLLEGSPRRITQACEGIKVPRALGQGLCCDITVSSTSLLPEFTKIYDMWSTHEVKCSLLSCVVQQRLPPEQLPRSKLQNKAAPKQTKRKTTETGPEDSTTKQSKKSKVPHAVDTPIEEAIIRIQEAGKGSSNTQGEKVSSSPWQFRIPPLPQGSGSSPPRKSPVDAVPCSSGGLDLYDL